MDEERYVQEMFENHFGVGKQDSLALYGLGWQTEYVIKHFPDCPIIGVLDGYKKNGLFCGKPVMTLEEVINYRAQIVILANEASKMIIYRRIRRICAENGIKVFDLEGKLLGEVTCCFEESEYYRRNLSELKNLINEYDCISFDIFDTLITRRGCNTDQMFALMERQVNCLEDFAAKRRNVEIELSNGHCPDIEEIYDCIAGRYCIGEAEKTFLMELELEYEKKLLLPRAEIIEMFYYALEHKKAVYLISDMYFHKDTIDMLLREVQISGYNDILVSCDYGTGKKQELYKIYRQQTNCQKYLHIGDSKENDVLAAQKHGIVAYQIKKPIEMAEMIPLGRQVLDRMSNQSDFAVSVFLTNAFLNPFVLYNCHGKYPVGTAFQLGYLFLGTIIMGFSLWLMEQLEKKHIDRVLFISRDGYLFKKVFDLLGSNVRTEYFLISRTASSLAAIESEEDIQYLVHMPFDGDLYELVENRFHIHRQKLIHELKTPDDVVKCYSHLIMETAQRERQNYLNYINELKFSEEERIALFDFVSSGTCHMNLEKIIGKSVMGFYFERTYDNHVRKNKLEVLDFVSTMTGKNRKYNYFWLETIIKETVPSIYKMDEEGNPVYCKTFLSKEQKRYVEEVQKGVMQYAKEYVSYKLYSTGDKVHPLFAAELVELISEQYLVIKAPELINTDVFTGREITVIEKEKIND